MFIPALRCDTKGNTHRLFFSTLCGAALSLCRTSLILDSVKETYSWHDFHSCKTQLDQYPYTSFARPDHHRVDPPKPQMNFDKVLDEENGNSEDDAQFASQGRFPSSFWNRVKILHGVENNEYAWIPAPVSFRV